MTTSTAKKRTITLTGRAPVTIREDRWPTIAKSWGDSWGTGDGARHDQARAQGELDEYAIRARQHADGRSIVSAVVIGATDWTGTESRRGGELLEPGAEIATAILRVGVDVGIPRDVIRECVADLPAEEIDDDDDVDLTAVHRAVTHQVESLRDVLQSWPASAARESLRDMLPMLTDGLQRLAQ